MLTVKEQIEMAKENEQLRAENERLLKALDRIGFYFAGTEMNHVSEFVIKAKRGEQV
jgi:hypothetical protein